MVSCRAKLAELADKICNLRDIATNPPADWSLFDEVYHAGKRRWPRKFVPTRSQRDKND